MKATEVARRYHDTWNGRDVDAVVGCFTKDGRYSNPDTYPGIGVEALPNYLEAVWAAVPDFSIEILNIGEIQPGLVADHWKLRGTDVGPRPDGSKGTGRTFTIKGVSIIQVEGDKIRSDQTYYDGRALDKQLLLPYDLQ
jgi:steroid delta-isomerase-like uncharacterized protein